MFHSFRAQDFIQLPPLGEAGTLTLVEELSLAARTIAKVPSPVASALNRLLDASSDLEKQIALREKSGSRADPRARAADRALDDAWGAMQSWLLGWTKLPDAAHPSVADARALYSGLFPKGLQFLTLDFKDEWTESQNRIDQIAKHGLDRFFDQLGGRPFLETILQAHRAYGEALHITSGSSGQPEPDAHVRRALEATHMALREYVAQVAAMVRRDDRASIEAAAALLAPVSARAVLDADDATQVSRRS